MDKDSNIQVFIRVRPLLSIEKNTESIIEILSDVVLYFRVEKNSEDCNGFNESYRDEFR
jgi:hypothetical protein